jgi:hypothetical protein
MIDDNSEDFVGMLCVNPSDFKVGEQPESGIGSLSSYSGSSLESHYSKSSNWTKGKNK